jgi:predicted ArsR family transcriptional regulator
VRRNQFDAEAFVAFLVLLQAGPCTAAEAAPAIGVAPFTVRRWVKRLEWENDPTVRRSVQPRAKGQPGVTPYVFEAV